MGYLGFIIIIPLGALAVWSIRSIARWFRNDKFSFSWWRAYWICLSLGLLLGLASVFFWQYRLGKTAQLHAFPLPVRFEQRKTENDPWLESDMPPLIRCASGVTDVLALMALCLAPLAIGGFFKQTRERNEAAIAAAPQSPS